MRSNRKDSRQKLIDVLCVLAVAAVPTLAFGQAPPTTTTPSPPSALQGSDPTNCAPSGLDNANRRPGVTTGDASSSLSDRLAAGNGVLCPPSGVDPEIRAPTPDVGKTPVIPPPGSPGGNRNVQPK